MSELLNGKTAWEFASYWYTPDQIKYSIKNRYRDTTESMHIPSDIDSPEFAKWLTDQYRLAMAKGIDIAQQDANQEIARLRVKLTNCHDHLLREAVARLDHPELANHWGGWCIAAKKQLSGGTHEGGEHE